MSTQLHLLNANGQLSNLDTRISICFAESLKTIEKMIGVLNVDVVVFSDAQRVIPELGIGGYAPSADRIHIAVDPQHPDFRSHLESVFRRALAHELHHCARWSRPGYGQTLGEALISEGLACLFEVEVSDEYPPFYARALTREQLALLLPRAEKELASHSYNHAAWFLGDPDTGIPRHAGYSIGYHLASKYSLCHDRKASQLVTEPASSFLDNYRIAACDV